MLGLDLGGSLISLGGFAGSGNLGKLLLLVNTRIKDAGYAGLLSGPHSAEAGSGADGGIVSGNITQLRENSGSPLGDEGSEQNRPPANGLQQMVKNGPQAFALGLVLRQCPRRSLIDILVGPAEQVKDGGKGRRKRGIPP